MLYLQLSSLMMMMRTHLQSDKTDSIEKPVRICGLSLGCIYNYKLEFLSDVDSDSEHQGSIETSATAQV